MLLQLKGFMSDNSCKSENEETECEALKQIKIELNNCQLINQGVSHNVRNKTKRVKKSSVERDV